MLYPRGCNILQFGILIYFIPFGLLNFFGVLSSLFMSNHFQVGVISLFDFTTLVSYHDSRVYCFSFHFRVGFHPTFQVREGDAFPYLPGTQPGTYLLPRY
jgi:hypothetical protein